MEMVASTLRMPEQVHQRLKEWAAADGRSINEIVVEILDRETKRWSTLRALEGADRLREELRAQYGEFPDSTPLIRELREERVNRV